MAVFYLQKMLSLKYNIKYKEKIRVRFTKPKRSTYTNCQWADQSQKHKFFEAASQCNRKQCCPVTMPSRLKCPFYQHVSSLCDRHRWNTVIPDSVPTEQGQSLDPLYLLIWVHASTNKCRKWHFIQHVMYVTIVCFIMLLPQVTMLHNVCTYEYSLRYTSKWQKLFLHGHFRLTAF